MDAGETVTGPDLKETKVVPDENFDPSPEYPTWLTADITSTFTILLAIFFPSVTGDYSFVFYSTPRQKSNIGEGREGRERREAGGRV